MPLRRPSPTAPRASFHRRASLRLTAAAPVTAGQSRFPCAGGHQRRVLLCATGSTLPTRQRALACASRRQRVTGAAGSAGLLVLAEGIAQTGGTWRLAAVRILGCATRPQGKGHMGALIGGALSAVFGLMLVSASLAGCRSADVSGQGRAAHEVTALRYMRASQKGRDVTVGRIPF